MVKTVFEFTLMHTRAQGEPVTASWDDSLLNIITKQMWAPSRFKDNYRTKPNFIKTDLLVYDVDNGLTVTEAVQALDTAGLAYLITASKSHGLLKNDVTCDRFRIVLQLSQPITDESVYLSTWFDFSGRHLRDAVDQSCKDVSRFYNPSTGAMAPIWGAGTGTVAPIEVKERGELAQHRSPQLRSLPTGGIRGQLSRKTLSLLLEGMPAGDRHTPVYKMAKDFLEQGYPIEEALERFRKAYDWWDDNATENVIDSYNRGGKYPPRKISADQSTIDFVHETIKEMNIAVSFSRVTYVNGVSSSREAVLRAMRIKRLAADLSRFHKDKDLADVYDEWVEERRTGHVEAARKTISGYDERGIVELSRFVEALTGRVDEVDTQVLCHWIWQVKRRMHSLPIVEHIMPIFFGEQGSGKSYAIHNLLLKPLGDLVATTNMKAVVDSREGKLLTEHFVVTLDELSFAERFDKEELKRIITSEIVKQRVMRETIIETGAMKASFIASTNKSVKHIIQDDTGMRRYYEIECLQKMNREVLNNIDYNIMWKCVGEDTPTDEAPIYKVHTVVNERQALLRHKKPIEEWLIDNDDFEVDETGASWVSAKDLVDSFNRWHRSTYTMTSFGRELSLIAGLKRRVYCGYKQYAIKRKQVIPFQKAVGNEY